MISLRKLHIAAGITLGILPAAAIPYFGCGFESGMPEGFTLHDRDAQALHFTMVQLGFSDTDTWTVLREEGTDNHYAASASRFKKAKGETAHPADDWMVTPPVWIRSDDAVLSWRGASFNDRNTSQSSYKVFISTEGPSPEKFTEDPVAVVDGEDIRRWTSREVALGEYAGKRVYIAFVNTSDDSDVLGIDDISVSGSPGIADLEIHPGEYTIGSEEIVLGGRLTATSSETVNTLSVSFAIGGKEYHAEYADLGLSKGETFEFELPDRIYAGYGDTMEFTVSSEVNGVRYDDLHRATTLLAFMPTKRVVVEEATGMWCGYCPEGIVAMETLQERHPDTFIGVAVHVNDLITVPGYGDTMYFPAGAPTAWVDRRDYCESLLTSVTEGGTYTFTTLRGGIETMFLERLAEQALADIDVKAELGDAGRLMKVDVTSRFAMNFRGCDFRVALLVTEDKVWEHGYYQSNYHSGRNESLSGFESLPRTILSDFEFNHVARAVYGSYQGVKGSLPNDLEAGRDYGYSVSWELPREVNPANAKVVAMLVDGATGEVMNASAVGVATSGVGSNLEEAGEADIEVYNLSGRLVNRTHGEVSRAVESLPGGVYVVRSMVSGGDVTVRKIAVTQQ